MILRSDRVERPAVSVRTATVADLPFLDALQDRFSHQVGYLTKDALRKRLEAGQVQLATENGQPACYVLGALGYRRQPRVAIVFQAAVEFDAQRRLISTCTVERWAATAGAGADQLLCWCAQDIDANFFWRSLGFEALAWRAGPVRKGRIHILWTRHAPGYSSERPLFIPTATDGGAIQHRRDVKLFEPGQSWDVRPSVNWAALGAAEQAAKLAADAKRLATGERRVRSAAKKLARSSAVHVERHATFSGQVLVDGVPRVDRPRFRRLLVGGRIREIPID